MKVALRTLHTIYGFVVFLLLFIILFPLLLIPIIFPKRFFLVGIINRWWAKGLFIFTFLPYRVVCKAPLNKSKQYVFCPNHFSYLDIPTMGLNPINTIFVGKNDMEKIPLFGFMYRKLHITVNRQSLKSRSSTLLASMKALDEGKSLVIYPEGGIITQHPPRMVHFKDGAFRAAIEKQVAVVPVTITNNWIILPDQKQLRLHWGRVEVIFHEPIETKGLTLDNVQQLKNQVFNIIDAELNRKYSQAL
ncbi:MAG: 1-acyl-sn-glycerol-3-phosphate acyltransferase [Bacteroidetes bacterium]|nr:1-acyl-sn-glycerol-3-phosphate acyltransferase [Bacteroidota bacterium]